MNILRMRFSRHIVLALTLAVALLAPLGFAAPAFAAAALVKSGPPDGATVDTRAHVVNLVFSEAVDPSKSAITITGPGGARADEGDAHVDARATWVMEVTLKPNLPFGQYTVHWTSVSAVDGQTQTGSFHFSIAPRIQTMPPENSPVKWALPDNAVSVDIGIPLNPKGSSITVIGPDGTQANQGKSWLDSNGTTLRAALRPNATAGEYQVRWTAVTANDGITFSGSFRFTLSQDQRPGLPNSFPSSTRALPTPAIAAAPTLPRTGGWPLSLPILAGLGLLVGGLMTRKAWRAERIEKHERF